MNRLMIRPPFDTASKTAISENPPENRTESGIANGEKAPLGPDLAKIIMAWPQLAKHIHAAFLRSGGFYENATAD